MVLEIIMLIKDLAQRTPQWYEHRQSYINASEVSVIVGYNPYKDYGQLILERFFPLSNSFFGNKYVEHGIKMEPEARLFFEKKTQLSFPDVVFVDDQVKIFSASLDGYNQEKNVLLEIKCPYVEPNGKIASSWDCFLNSKIVPKNYWAQVQCQLFCSRARFAYFFVYFSADRYFVSRIYPDQLFIAKMINDGLYFLEFLKKTRLELQQTVYLKSVSKFKGTEAFKCEKT